jgi:hypothetical protein
MEITPATKSEMYHGYSPEKLKALQEYAIYDFDKLVRGRKYALLSNGYYLGAYDSSEFISHVELDCKCRYEIYKFTQVNSNGKHFTITRTSDFIKEIGVYEVTY